MLQNDSLSTEGLQAWQAGSNVKVKLLRAGKPENLSVVDLQPVEASAAGITKELSARDVPPLYLVCAARRMMMIFIHDFIHGSKVISPKACDVQK